MNTKKEDGKSLDFQKLFLFFAPPVLNRCALETLVVFLEIFTRFKYIYSYWVLRNSVHIVDGLAR